MTGVIKIINFQTTWFLHFDKQKIVSKIYSNMKSFIGSGTLFNQKTLGKRTVFQAKNNNKIKYVLRLIPTVLELDF